METERLIIRPFIDKDVDDYFEFAKDPRIGPNAAWMPHKDKKETLKYIKYYKKHEDIYAIELKKEKKVIGKIGLYKDVPVSDFFLLSQRELGFCINYNYWGNGYALEAAKALVDYAFKEFKIDLLWCGHFYYNHQSESVIKKLGFDFYNEIIYDAVDIGKKVLANMYYMKREKYLRGDLNGKIW